MLKTLTPFLRFYQSIILNVSGSKSRFANPFHHSASFYRSPIPVSKPHCPTKTAKFCVSYSAQALKKTTHCLTTTQQHETPIKDIWIPIIRFVCNGLVAHSMKSVSANPVFYTT